MSHAIYDEQWQEAMDKLQLLINIETVETEEEIEIASNTNEEQLQPIKKWGRVVLIF